MGARTGEARVGARPFPPPFPAIKCISLFGGLFATCSPCWGLFATFFSLHFFVLMRSFLWACPPYKNFCGRS